MPRQPRLDAPATLHHVMVRDRERRVLFRDDADRDDFVTRVASLADTEAWSVYAWALLPNHAHLLVRTGSRPLPRSRRSLRTGYAGAVNWRHKRVGHRFQNRYVWTGHSALLGDTQTRAAVSARQFLAYVWVEVLGRRASALACAWGQTRGNVTWAAERGATQAARWQTEIPRWCQ